MDRETAISSSVCSRPAPGSFLLASHGRCGSAGLRAHQHSRDRGDGPAGRVRRRRRAYRSSHTGASRTATSSASLRGLRHSSFARVLLESAARETEAELVRLVEEGVRRRLFILDKIEAMLARHARAPGLARLRRALAVYVDRGDRASVLEVAFDRELGKRPHSRRPSATSGSRPAGSSGRSIACGANRA